MGLPSWGIAQAHLVLSTGGGVKEAVEALGADEEITQAVEPVCSVYVGWPAGRASRSYGPAVRHFRARRITPAGWSWTLSRKASWPALTLTALVGDPVRKGTTGGDEAIRSCPKSCSLETLRVVRRAPYEHVPTLQSNGGSTAQRERTTRRKETDSSAAAGGRTRYISRPQGPLRGLAKRRHRVR